MKTSIKRRKGFTLVELLVVIAIIVALAGIATPMLLRQQKKAASTQALSNARQIGLALFDFDSDYSSFPDKSTADTVKENTGSSLTMTGSSSNDFFRQLIAAGNKSEKVFWCKTSYSTKKPDDIITPGKALDKGEVGFGYVMASQTDGQSSSGDPNRPVCVTPLFKAQPNWEFDPEPYGDKAVVLRLDGSARQETIRTDNKYISIQGGRFLQTNGDQTPWGTDITPVLRAPEPKGQ